jgi:hypothetical protein
MRSKVYDLAEERGVLLRVKGLSLLLRSLGVAVLRTESEGACGCLASLPPPL